MPHGAVVHLIPGAQPHPSSLYIEFDTWNELKGKITAMCRRLRISPTNFVRPGNPAKLIEADRHLLDADPVQIHVYHLPPGM